MSTVGETSQSEGKTAIRLPRPSGCLGQAVATMMYATLHLTGRRAGLKFEVFLFFFEFFHIF